MELFKSLASSGSVVPVVAFGVLVVIAALSRDLVAFLAATLLAALGCLILAFPEETIRLLTVWAGLASFLIAVAGLMARRKAEALDGRLNRLTAAIRRLEHAESSRVLRSVSTASSSPRAEVPTAPVEMTAPPVEMTVPPGEAEKSDIPTVTIEERSAPALSPASMPRSARKRKPEQVENPAA
jgi:hypothetical protein